MVSFYLEIKMFFVYLHPKLRFIVNNIILIYNMAHKKKYKFPIVYKLDESTYIVWKSPTECYQLKQLELLF